METFICSLYPAASLYEDVADENEVSKCFLELKEYLKDKNIDLITVKDALTLNNNVDGLMTLAYKALDYKRKDSEEKYEELVIKSRKDSFEEYLKYSSDEYKKSVLKKVSK